MKKYRRLILVLILAIVFVVNKEYFFGSFLYAGKLGAFLTSTIGSFIVMLAFTGLGVLSYPKKDKRD
ncbi:hypothetical protein EQG49_13455 [Periweissella cryptocerci]|uniref:Uncharacterized protein n=1 Tax=Periweissella cryptocerci TaxID=2506420 RepID=A0A4P6YX22_9LACO|nr:hypothetical protein [Periweissella cryptocerci]QBO37404.1 hypothetical protein EQG49_13455 [Periweissella cryptocerci]